MNGVTDMSSIVPPARINDLRMIRTQNRDTVELVWTAVGANMNQGKGQYIPTTLHNFLPLSTTVNTLHHSPPLSITLHHSPPFSTTLYHSPSLSTTLHHSSPLSTVLHHFYQSLPISKLSIILYYSPSPSLSLSIYTTLHHSSPLSITLHPSPPLL